MVSNVFYKKFIFNKKTKSYTQYETIINNYNSKMHSFPVYPLFAVTLFIIEKGLVT